MSTQRFNATPHLVSTLERKERSLGWLARKIGVSTSLMWFVSRGERTLAEDKAFRVANILDEPIEFLFVSTSVDNSVAEVAVA